MSSLEIATSPGRAVLRYPRNWYFIGSTVVGLIAHGAMVLGGS
jgi:hypothetical protein